MASDNFSFFKELLVSPLTGKPLLINDSGACCDHEQYPFNENGQLDLRLSHTKQVAITFDLPNKKEDLKGIKFNYAFLTEHPGDKINIEENEIPRHLSKELISYFPKAKEGGYMLDLGCGNKVHETVCKKTGFNYIGLDYGDPDADILGDAHALPFKSGVFDFVLSIAVLAHLRNPFVAVQEVNRVLKPGGTFIGTVAFLEPFNGNSYYHMTHLGVYSLLQSAGFDIQVIAPSKEWDFLEAQISMGYLPRIPSFLKKLFTLRLRIIHYLSWKMMEKFSRSEATRKNHNKLNSSLLTTGAFTFVATKHR